MSTVIMLIFSFLSYNILNSDYFYESNLFLYQDVVIISAYNKKEWKSEPSASRYLRRGTGKSSLFVYIVILD